MYLLPNLEDPYFDPDQWQDVLTDVLGHEDEYLVFQTMDSSHSFRTMQNFAVSLKESLIRSDLECALPHPDHSIILTPRLAQSPLREEWADFKFNAHMEWVKSQVDCYELVNEV